MIKSREIRLKSRPVGMPTVDNFELVTVSVPDPAPDEVQVKNLWMSVDPYMRGPHGRSRELWPVLSAGPGTPGARDRGSCCFQLDHVRLASAFPTGRRTGGGRDRESRHFQRSPT